MADGTTRLKIWREPPIRYLVNCAVAHGVSLSEVCEPEWLDWTEFVAGVRHPNAAPRRES